MIPNNEESGVPLWGFLAGAALLIVAALAAVWFMFPAPDTRHDLVSPSGAVRIELGELCGETGCARVAILDTGGERRGCPLALEGNRPLFAEVSAVWAPDETSVVLHYGAGGTLTIARADCTITNG